MPEEEAPVAARGAVLRSLNRTRPAVFRSVNTGIRFKVIFRNRSRRRVKPVWVDFKGEPRPYPIIEPDSEGTKIVTYLGHAWLFRDADTDDRLLANEQAVLVASPNVNGQPVYVNITLPVYTLKQRCLQVIRKLVKAEDYRKLELVHSLYDDLENHTDVRKDLEKLSGLLTERISAKRESGAQSS